MDYVPPVYEQIVEQSKSNTVVINGRQMFIYKPQGIAADAPFTMSETHAPMTTDFDWKSPDERKP